MKVSKYALLLPILHLSASLASGGDLCLSETTARDEALRRASDARSAAATEKLALATNIAAKCSVLAAALSQELQEPSKVRRHNSYLAQSEMAQMRYIEQLSAFGANAVPYYDSLLTSASNQAAALLIIGRDMAGYLKSRPVVHELSRESDHPFVRMMAVRALGVNAQPGERALLVQALSDAFFVDGSDSVGTYRIYPVREEACRVLEKIGVRVVRVGDLFEVRE